MKLPIRATAILLLLFAAGMIATGCESGEDAAVFHYRHGKISLTNLNNAGEQAAVSEDNIIPRNAYAVRMVLERDVAEYTSPESSAAAGSGPADYLPLDTIGAIRFVTLNRLSEDYPAESDVTGLFRAYMTPDIDTNPYLTVREFVDGIDPVLHYMTDLEADFMLMLSPTADTRHRFRVEVHLTDGVIITMETEEVLLI